MIRLRHIDVATARFVTFSCYRRYRLFRNAALITNFLDVLNSVRNARDLRLLGYVVMPSHVHLVLLPPDRLLQGTGDDAPMVFWQRWCYDHNCRTPETVREKIEYCHKNPVLRGLVNEPGQWRWSSYNWYGGQRDVPIRIDTYGD